MPHIHFIAIGGAGIAPLALVASQAGYKVSGSDIKESAYVTYLKTHGIADISIGDNDKVLENMHSNDPIDWIVYSSALNANNQAQPIEELARKLGIRISKRDEFINEIISSHKLEMIAIAGTHGKTTTTAMTIWLFKKLNKPISYMLPAKISFGEMGEFNPDSEYFIYEADEYDKNFLSFKPYISLITGIGWDHHEVYKTKEDYLQAFSQFISQSNKSIIWKDDLKGVKTIPDRTIVLSDDDRNLDSIKLSGIFNRRDALLAATSVNRVTDTEIRDLIKLINDFPGLSRRMEEIAPNLYSDYAHTPEKIRAAISVAQELAKGRKIVLIYEPLTNRRQTYIKNEYKDCFKGVDKIYWVDSYLAREDSSVPIISPSELINYLDDPSVAEPAKLGATLISDIKYHLDHGDMVIIMSGGGADSLDEWVRTQFESSS